MLGLQSLKHRGDVARTMIADIQKIKENLHKQAERQRQARLKRFDAATNDFRAIVQMLIKRYSPKKIVQWGSLLHSDQFDENSDIDIAIEGISDAAAYFALLGDAMELTRFPLDIVQLEKIEPEFAELILLKGKIIYES
jgi:predicted nucleotidyltransferase